MACFQYLKSQHVDWSWDGFESWRAGVSGWKQVVGVVDKPGIVVVGIVCTLVKAGIAGKEANAQRLVLQVTRWSRVA